MSRSRRHSPIIGIVPAPSDKVWKQQVARKLRRAVHQTLDQTADGDAVPVDKQAMGAADRHGLKDGKTFLANPTPEQMRK